MFHFSPPLLLAQLLYCCSIDRHVISYMNNARGETKIVALLLTLSWLGFVLQWFKWIGSGWFLFTAASHFVKSNRDLDLKVLGFPKPYSYWNRLQQLIGRSGCRFIQPLRAGGFLILDHQGGSQDNPIHQPKPGAAICTYAGLLNLFIALFTYTN